MQLDAFWSARLPPSRRGTRWLNLFKTLVIYRLLDPGSEWRLYRCLDKLLEHKQTFFTMLKAGWQDLFGITFNVPLYDLTGTYTSGHYD